MPGEIIDPKIIKLGRGDDVRIYVSLEKMEIRAIGDMLIISGDKEPVNKVIANGHLYVHETANRASFIAKGEVAIVILPNRRFTVTGSENGFDQTMGSETPVIYRAGVKGNPKMVDYDGVIVRATAGEWR